MDFVLIGGVDIIFVCESFCASGSVLNPADQKVTFCVLNIPTINKNIARGTTDPRVNFCLEK